MSAEVMRRTFAAKKAPPGSDERAKLNRDTLTSEYYTSHRYMTRARAFMSDGTPNKAQPYHVRTFKNKADAEAYAERTRPKP